MTDADTDINPDDYDIDDFCAIHGYEPLPPQYFRICGECGHAYGSADELLAADLAVVTALAESTAAAGDTIPVQVHAARTVEQVHCCPLCTHDW